MNRNHRLAIVCIGLVGCAPDDPAPADPAEVLAGCELPEPCMPAAYDLCAVSGPDEAATRCVLAALSGTGPVHVSASRATICGDVPDNSALDIFRWEDGSATCLSQTIDGTPGGRLTVYACDSLPRVECRDLDEGAPVPDLCLDFRNWEIGGDAEIEAVCH